MVAIDHTVSSTKSRFLMFLGKEFGELLSSFCCNKKIGTVFHRTKADPHALLSNALEKHSTEAHTCQITFKYKTKVKVCIQ